MRPLLPGLICLMPLLSLLGCGSDTPTQSPTQSSTATPAAPIDGPSLAQAGQEVDALGVYTLTVDPADPLMATLAPVREAAAVGDLYALSIRPFMGPAHLQLVDVGTGPNNTVAYTIEFTHPIPMPADVDRPATQTKRLDLFLFDVNLVVVIPGTETYFNGSIRTNPSAVSNPDGYRMLGPMVNLSVLGIGDDTNVFPYRVLSHYNSANPDGNYDPTLGWSANELLEPTGYDVIPQGDNVSTTVYLTPDAPTSLYVVVVAKYQDPRNGVTIGEKRANRLPDPANPSLLRYFLPEASGDLQKIQVAVDGALIDTSSHQTATVTATIRDWDHAATVAAAFPNHSALTEISESSVPTAVALDIPDLLADGEFPGVLGSSSGDLDETISATFAVKNEDQSLAVSNPDGIEVIGFMRVRDSQDSSSPAALVLDESLVAQSMPGFELSTRFQRVSVLVGPGTPELGVVTPGTMQPGAQLALSASLLRGGATSWYWEFDGGVTPATSLEANPVVTIGVPGQEREYTGTVTAISPFGQDSLDFTLTTALLPPTLPPTPYDYTVALPAHYTNTNFDDGDAAARTDNTPPTNPITDAGATLGRVLFYDVRLSRNKAVACATCHQQSNNFADDTPKSLGFQGGETKRHVPTLTNARYYDSGRFFYDERSATLEEAVLLPIQDTVEMGFTLPELEQRLAATTYYPDLFEAAFGTPEVTSDRISAALAQFTRSLVSATSKFDRVVSNSPLPNSEFTSQEQSGFNIFTGQSSGWSGGNPMSCGQCHRTTAQTSGGPNVVPSSGPAIPAGPFAANNGLDAAIGSDVGAGQGRFKAPSLRNIEVSAPYMHDGRFTTLEEIVDFYTQDVADTPNTHAFLHEDDEIGMPVERFALSNNQKTALIAFMKTLTDDQFLTDPKFSDPFAY